MKKKLTETWAEIQSERLEEEFNKAAKDFIWQFQTGGGIKNTFIIDTIKELNQLYWANCGYKSAMNNMKVEV